MPLLPPIFTVADIVRRHASTRGSAAALLATGRPPLSYEELAGEMTRMAATLRSAGVGPSSGAMRPNHEWLN